MGELTDKLLDITERDGIVHMRFRHGRVEGVYIPQVEREFGEMLKAHSCERVVVHFDNITYFPTVGLGAMIALRKYLKERRAQIRFTGMRPLVRELFAVSALDRVFQIHDSEVDAIASFE